eukprot:403344623
MITQILNDAVLSQEQTSNIDRIQKNKTNLFGKQDHKLRFSGQSSNSLNMTTQHKKPVTTPQPVNLQIQEKALPPTPISLRDLSQTVNGGDFGFPQFFFSETTTSIVRSVQSFYKTDPTLPYGLMINGASYSEGAIAATLIAQPFFMIMNNDYNIEIARTYTDFAEILICKQTSDMNFYIYCLALIDGNISSSIQGGFIKLNRTTGNLEQMVRVVDGINGILDTGSPFGYDFHIGKDNAKLYAILNIITQSEQMQLIAAVVTIDSSSGSAFQSIKAYSFGDAGLQGMIAGFTIAQGNDDFIYIGGSAYNQTQTKTFPVIAKFDQNDLTNEPTNTQCENIVSEWYTNGAGVSAMTYYSVWNSMIAFISPYSSSRRYTDTVYIIEHPFNIGTRRYMFSVLTAEIWVAQVREDTYSNRLVGLMDIYESTDYQRAIFKFASDLSSVDLHKITLGNLGVTYMTIVGSTIFHTGVYQYDTSNSNYAGYIDRVQSNFFHGSELPIILQRTEPVILNNDVYPASNNIKAQILGMSLSEITLFSSEFLTDVHSLNNYIRDNNIAINTTTLPPLKSKLQIVSDKNSEINYVKGQTQIDVTFTSSFSYCDVTTCFPLTPTVTYTITSIPSLGSYSSLPLYLDSTNSQLQIYSATSSSIISEGTYYLCIQGQDSTTKASAFYTLTLYVFEDSSSIVVTPSNVEITADSEINSAGTTSGGLFSEIVDQSNTEPYINKTIYPMTDIIILRDQSYVGTYFVPQDDQGNAFNITFLIKYSNGSSVKNLSSWVTYSSSNNILVISPYNVSNVGNYTGMIKLQETSTSDFYSQTYTFNVKILPTSADLKPTLNTTNSTNTSTSQNQTQIDEKILSDPILKELYEIDTNEATGKQSVRSLSMQIKSVSNKGKVTIYFTQNCQLINDLSLFKKDKVFEVKLITNLDQLQASNQSTGLGQISGRRNLIDKNSERLLDIGNNEAVQSGEGGLDWNVKSMTQNSLQIQLYSAKKTTNTKDRYFVSIKLAKQNYFKSTNKKLMKTDSINMIQRIRMSTLESNSTTTNSQITTSTALSQATKATAAAATGAVIAIQIVMGGSLTYLFSMINTIQILTLLPLQNLIMPDFLQEFFILMNSFNFQIFDFQLADRILDLRRSIEPFNNAFEDAGYETSNVLINASDIFVFVVQGLIVAFVSYLFYRFSKNQIQVFKDKNTREDPLHLRKYGGAYENFKDDSQSRLFEFLFIARRLIVVLSVLFLEKFPMMQWIIYNYFSLAMTVYVLQVRPFKERNLNIQEALNQLSVSVIGFCSLFLTDYFYEEDKAILSGWIIIGGFVINAIINWIFLALEKIVILRQNWNKRKEIWARVKQFLKQILSQNNDQLQDQDSKQYHDKLPNDSIITNQNLYNNNMNDNSFDNGFPQSPSKRVSTTTSTRRPLNTPANSNIRTTKQSNQTLAQTEY